MCHDIDLVGEFLELDEPGDPVSLRVQFPGMAFDLPGLVGGVHFDLQGACVRFNARFADSTFQIPVFRGHGAHVGSAQFTESLLLFASRFF